MVLFLVQYWNTIMHKTGSRPLKAIRQFLNTCKSRYWMLASTGICIYFLKYHCWADTHFKNILKSWNSCGHFRGQAPQLQKPWFKGIIGQIWQYFEGSSKDKCSGKSPKWPITAALAIIGCSYLPLANKLVAELAVELVMLEFAWTETSDRRESHNRYCMEVIYSGSDQDL